MFLVPLLIAAMLLILGAGIALYFLETKYLPRLGLSLYELSLIHIWSNAALPSYPSPHAYHSIYLPLIIKNFFKKPPESYRTALRYLLAEVCVLDVFVRQKLRAGAAQADACLVYTSRCV